ncbi:MAG: 50S ribosomal protein L29 [Candidatus Aminicenantes bacterium]|jgi:large subunit ribosomal protein L29
MKGKEIRSMTESEINSKLEEFQDKLFKQKMQKSLGQAENPHKIRQTKKDIARLITILAEKKRSNYGKGKSEPESKSSAPAASTQAARRKKKG